MFQLVDTGSGAVLAVTVPLTGNVRSYLVAPGEPGYGTGSVDQSYAYDQALCLLAAIARNQATVAQQLAAGLLALQTRDGSAADGGFRFAGPQLSPGYGPAVYRTGAHAIGTYALLSYLAYAPGDTTQDYAGAARAALSWLGTQLLTSGPGAGLYTGGTGNAGGSGDQENITWCSTEHQFDVWHSLVTAAAVLSDSTWLTQAAALKTAVLAALWDPGLGRFYQGTDPTGAQLVPDTGSPLDVHSWGAIWATCCGRADIAATVLTPAALAPFAVTDSAVTGYQPEYADDPSGDYPGATPTVWSEGTFFTAYALKRIGSASRAAPVIAGIDPGQQPGGSFAYCSTYDPVYGLTPSQCVIGPAWAILAAKGSGIWTETAT